MCNNLTQKVKRSIAVSAAREQLRKSGFSDTELIYTIEAQGALLALDDLLLFDKSLIASIWYKNARENQIMLFGRDWRRWQKNRNNWI